MLSERVLNTVADRAVDARGPRDLQGVAVFPAAAAAAQRGRLDGVGLLVGKGVRTRLVVAVPAVLPEILVRLEP